MKNVKAIQLAGVVILLGFSAWAQEFPRFELGADYSFARFNPNAAYTNGHSLNGGGGSFVVNINEFLGIKMDLQGYQSQTHNFVVPSGLSFPGGKVVAFRPAEFDYLLTHFTNQFANSNQNNFRYSAGLVFSFGHTTY